MNTTAKTSANPAADAGSNPQPNLTVVPSQRKRRGPANPFALTKAQRTEVKLTLKLCAEAAKADYAGPLEANTVTPAFLKTLEDDAKAAETMGRAALNATNSRKTCTEAEATARTELMECLRKIQATARAAYADSQPERVNNYLVGNEIDANRDTLESSATTLIHQADTDRPGSIDTAFITAATEKSRGYANSQSATLSDIGTAKEKRQLRTALVETIRERRKKVQRAAESAWPHTNRQNAKARKLFRLPPNRPYSY